MDINKLYNDIILQYAREKENFGVIENTEFVERGHNPSCGDDIVLYIYENFGKLEDIKFSGSGCAISTSSVNMMIDLLKNKDLNVVEKIVDIFFKMMNFEDITEDEKQLLEDASILEFTADMVARKKCATLSWHSMKVLLNKLKNKLKEEKY